MCFLEFFFFAGERLDRHVYGLWLVMAWCLTAVASSSVDLVSKSGRLLCQRSLGATRGPLDSQNLSRRRWTRARRVPQPSTSAPALHFLLSDVSAPQDQLSKTCQNPLQTSPVSRCWWASRRFSVFLLHTAGGTASSSTKTWTRWTTWGHFIRYTHFSV